MKIINSKIFSELLLVILFFGMFLSVINVHQVEAEDSIIWIVDDDGPADFSSIQEAINSADEGDVIFVKNGTYNEVLTVNKAVSLIGETNKSTIINGVVNSGTTITILTDRVNITDFTIQTSAEMGAECMRIYSCFNNISFNKFQGTHYITGIYNVAGSENNIISGNYFSVYGAIQGVTTGTTISKNTLFHHFSSVSLTGSNNLILQNLIESTEIALGITGSHNKIIENTFSGMGYIKMYGGNNIFYHNNLFPNWDDSEPWDGGLFSPYIFTDGLSNQWDDGFPSGGNYISLYQARYAGATEIENSGIWDTPWEIDENNQDNYPLIEPWTPPSPEEKILDLIDVVESMNLQQGIDNQLDSKLQNVIDSIVALNADKRNDAVNKLESFISAVEAQIGNKITEDQGSYLVSEAQEIINLISSLAL